MDVINSSLLLIQAGIRNIAKIPKISYPNVFYYNKLTSFHWKFTFSEKNCLIGAKLTS